MESVKILVVDDEPDILEFLRYNLVKEGYDVSTANNGEEGIKKAEAEKPNLIILDIMMPPPDGFTLTSMLRDDVKFARTPILIITALDNSNSRATTLGANGYLAKPFNLDELAAKIMELIGSLK